MSSTSAGKRAREKKLQERAAMKRERRIERASRADDGEQPDADVLMEQFRVLSEAYAAGAIEADDYEAQRQAIFEALGLQSDGA